VSILKQKKDTLKQTKFMRKITFLFLFSLLLNVSNLLAQDYLVNTWYEIDVSAATLNGRPSCVHIEDPSCWNGTISTGVNWSGGPYGSPAFTGAVGYIEGGIYDSAPVWDGTSVAYVSQWTGVSGLVNPMRPGKIKFRIPASWVPQGTCKGFYLWEIPCIYEQACIYKFPNPIYINVCNPAPNPAEPSGCVASSISTLDGLSCAKFTRFNNATCSSCYCVKVQFTDNTTTSFNINFGSGNTVMNCFSKTISSVVSIIPSTNCGGCESGTTFKQVSVSDEKTETEKQKIIVSPNPAISVLRFEGPDLSKYKISIYDVTGKEIFKESKIDTEINISKLTSGVYLYIIKDNLGFSQEGKIVKK